MSAFRFCPRCATALEEMADHEGRVRRRCGGCGFIHYDNPTPVVAAIVEHEGEIVLVRSHGWPEAWFGLVTGFLEREEEAEEAVLREVKEELGLEGEIVSFVGIYSFFQMNQIILAWHVRAAGTVVLGAELAASKRVSPERLRPWPMGTGKAVADWLARRAASSGLAATPGGEDQGSGDPRGR